MTVTKPSVAKVPLTYQPPETIYERKQSKVPTRAIKIPTKQVQEGGGKVQTSQGVGPTSELVETSAIGAKPTAMGPATLPAVSAKTLEGQVVSAAPAAEPSAQLKLSTPPVAAPPSATAIKPTAETAVLPAAPAKPSTLPAAITQPAATVKTTPEPAVLTKPPATSAAAQFGSYVFSEIVVQGAPLVLNLALAKYVSIKQEELEKKLIEWETKNLQPEIDKKKAGLAVLARNEPGYRKQIAIGKLYYQITLVITQMGGLIVPTPSGMLLPLGEAPMIFVELESVQLSTSYLESEHQKQKGHFGWMESVTTIIYSEPVNIQDETNP